jgi:chromosome segregation ATPase
MRYLLIVVVVLAVAVGGVGYCRGWFGFTTDGKVDVHVDRAKFKQDRVAFAKTVGEQAKSMKVKVAGLWKKAEGLTGDDRKAAEKELGELNAKHARLEQQLTDLEEAGDDRFETIKQDLSNTLEEVDREIEGLRNKLEKGNAK